MNVPPIMGIVWLSSRLRLDQTNSLSSYFIKRRRKCNRIYLHPS